MKSVSAGVEAIDRQLGHGAAASGVDLHDAQGLAALVAQDDLGVAGLALGHGAEIEARRLEHEPGLRRCQGRHQQGQQDGG